MTRLKDQRRTVRNLYRNVDGFEVPPAEFRKLGMRRSTAIYGELTGTGVQQLLAYLRLNEADVFYDLGSGVGKVVLQTAISTKVRKCVGVELSKVRCDRSQAVLKDARRRNLLLAGRCAFRHEDFLKSNFSDATVLYTCATAFPSQMMKGLVRKLRELDRELILVTLQAVDADPRLKLIDTLPLRATWNPRVQAFVYLVEKASGAGRAKANRRWRRLAARAARVPVRTVFTSVSS